MSFAAQAIVAGKAEQKYKLSVEASEGFSRRFSTFFHVFHVFFPCFQVFFQVFWGVFSSVLERFHGG